MGTGVLHEVKSGLGTRGIFHLPHLVLRLQMNTAIPLLPICVFMPCYMVNFTLLSQY